MKYTTVFDVIPGLCLLFLSDDYRTRNLGKTSSTVDCLQVI